MAAAVAEAPYALIVLRDKSSERVVALHGGLPSCADAPAFWRAAVASAQATIIPDARLDPMLHALELVSGETHLRSLTAVPVRNQRNEILGALCVFDTAPRMLSVATLELLDRLAVIVAEKAPSALAAVAAAEGASRAPLRTLRQNQVAEALPKAVAKHAFQLYLQPQIDVREGRTIGFEVLLRWNDPVLGWIEPGEFIPLAEESGEIVRIGHWMIGTCCDIAGAWGPRAPFIAINLSARQFADPELAACVATSMSKANLAPGGISLEVNASTLLADVETSRRRVAALKNVGARVYVDNFGVNAADRDPLAQLGVDGVKIDQRLLAEAGTVFGADRDEGIVTALVELTQGLGLAAVGTGVENERQFDFLKRIGCQMAQGFLLGQPVPADQVHGAARRG